MLTRLLRIPVPLTIIQVLAVDLGTDMVPGTPCLVPRPDRRGLPRKHPARLPATCRVPDYAEFRIGGVPFWAVDDQFGTCQVGIIRVSSRLRLLSRERRRHAGALRRKSRYGSAATLGNPWRAS